MTQPAASLSEPATTTSAAEARDDRMPSGIPFIIANEFAERFCYYGINAILTIYMTQFLRYGDADATTFHSLFKSGAYFFPLVGAVISDVFWGKYRTIMTFSLVYATGCAVVALVPGTTGLFIGLSMVAFGTGGIKPCVSTNVGDQFTSKNQHLIERAFSFFYLAINAGSSISIYLCPTILDPADPDAPRWLADFFLHNGLTGPRVAFGMPAVMMFIATFAFWMGRKKFAVVPPAGKAWLREVLSKEGLRLIGSLAIIYFFVACFWALWDQANGQTWTLQAKSSLMDKNLGFGIKLQAAQIQVVNGLFILALVPVFTFGVFPLWGKFFKVTPLRKIAVGLFTIASSFLIVARIEERIQAGETVSVWWQILAYVVLTASEILVSITALEFSYKQAPLRIKSFIMALFLLSTSVGNMMTAGVNSAMVRPLKATSAEIGTETWVTLEDVGGFVSGQKIDFKGQTGAILVGADGNPIITDKKTNKPDTLQGTYLVAETDVPRKRVKLMNVVDRKPVATTGTFDAAKTSVSTYKLVGPQYFNFFAMMMAGVGVIFIFVAMFYKEKTHVRTEDDGEKA